MKKVIFSFWLVCGIIATDAAAATTSPLVDLLNLLHSRFLQKSDAGEEDDTYRADQNKQSEEKSDTQSVLSQNMPIVKWVSTPDDNLKLYIRSGDKEIGENIKQNREITESVNGEDGVGDEETEKAVASRDKKEFLNSEGGRSSDNTESLASVENEMQTLLGDVNFPIEVYPKERFTLRNKRMEPRSSKIIARQNVESGNESQCICEEAYSGGHSESRERGRYKPSRRGLERPRGINGCAVGKRHYRHNSENFDNIIHAIYVEMRRQTRILRRIENMLEEIQKEGGQWRSRNFEFE